MASLLCGASELCIQTITVNDQTLPTIICPNVISPILCQATPIFPPATATDLCGGIPTITFMDVTVQNDVTRTWTATDNCGNASTCDRTITVNDQTAPTIVCPAVISPVQCPAIPIFPPATATDLCDANPIITFSDVTLQNSVTRTWTATDNHGNASMCDRTIVVESNAPPTITCPSNIVRNTDLNLCNTVVNYALPTFTNNCYGVTLALASGLASGSAFFKGVNMVTFTATDGVGNIAVCGFTITVNDNQAPKIVCPSNKIQSTDPNLCTAVVTYPPPTATDNCTSPLPNIMLQSGLPNGAIFPKGITIIIFKATDGAGLTKTCSFRVTVNDTQAPVITCPLSIVTNTDVNLCSAVTIYAPPTFIDNCFSGSVVRLSGLASGSAFPKGVSTMVWKATDAAGNSKTCSFTVTVNDVQLPLITCPADIIKSTESGLCASVGVYATPVATDNCLGVTTMQVSGLASGSLFPLGISNVIWKATDGVGLMKTCMFTVTVNDTQAPMAMCPGNITVNGSGNPCGYLSANLLSATVMMENCLDFTLTSDAPVILLVGTTPITWTATDPANNVSVCAYMVTVNCTTAPLSSGGNSNGVQSKSVRIADTGLELTVAPNPATSQVTFFLEGLGRNGGRLTLFDQLGRMAWQQSVTSEQVHVSLDVNQSNLAPGLYRVRLLTEQGIVTKGLVINKL